MITARYRRPVAGLAIALVAAPLGAQGARFVHGTVRTLAGAPLPGAFVFAPTLPGRPSTSAGSAGAFSLRLPADPVQLVAASIGCAPETVMVAPEASSVAFHLAPAPVALDPVAVTAEPAYSTASSGVIRALDIRLRPRESSQDLLGLAPGLVIAQHAGGGKAEQIFLRGFDADHGTDVAISADGTPVNMVSHAHGQGYADLHFLIPEVVERVEVRKGLFDARDSDFATAGAVSFYTRDRVDGAEVATRGGSFGTAHSLALLPLGGDLDRAGGYVAAAGHLSRGPFDRSQDYGRYNLFGKGTAPLGARAELVASASSFAARWNASGQVPERAVSAGLISRFGAIDPTEGGRTRRDDLALGLRSRGEPTQWEARVYGVRYRLRLYSNFTFFLNDTVNGDGIEQLDERWLAGGHVSVRRPTVLAGRPGLTSAGLGLRADVADVGLFHQVRRTRLDTVVSSHVSQQHVFGWGRQEIALSDRVRVDFGVRADAFRFAVGPRAVWRRLVSPKANLAVRVAERTTAFASVGAGFHSNDARDATAAGPADRIVPRALAAEAGARHAWGSGTVAASAWALDLESELVYVGDEGTTEASSRARRLGLDLEARLRLAPWLWADADVNLASARFTNAPRGANRVPLAPTVTSTGGLTIRDLGPVSGGLRYRFVGSRPADESGAVTARGYLVWELFGRWRVSRVDVTFAIDNLVDVAWNEAQFATTSRLRGETAPVTELHFTPGAPRSLQLGLSYRP